jgi:DNA polymerase-3 subunit epsilon
VIVALDTETTGLSPERHQVLEVGAVRLDAEEREAGRLLLAVAIEAWLPAHPDEIAPALQINGIDPYGPAWANALTYREAFTRLAEFVEDCRLVLGHNVSFDLRFLRAGFRRLGLPVPEVLADDRRTLCTRRMAQILVRDGVIPDARLETLCQHYGVSNAGAHRALADVVRTIAVYRELDRYAPERDPERPPTPAAPRAPVEPLSFVAAGEMAGVVASGCLLQDWPEPVAPRPLPPGLAAGLQAWGERWFRNRAAPPPPPPVPLPTQPFSLASSLPPIQPQRRRRTA